MKYPKIPRDLRPDIKIKDKDIVEIRELSRNGWSQRQIAKRIGVSKFAVSRYLMSYEKLEEIKAKQRIRSRNNPRPKEKREGEGLKTYALRKKVLGSTALKHNNLLKLNSLSPQERLNSWAFHKEKLGNLLEVEPLLILFVSKKDRIKVCTS